MINKTQQKDLQLTGGLGNKPRRELDFYPTPSECTIALMDFLQEREVIPHHSFGTKTIWEPACGNGAMADVIRSYHHFVICSDIALECDINGKQFPAGNSNTDFLCDSVGYDNIDAIITNPPFNKSIEFIEKSLKQAPVVAMLLKSQYWHAKGRYDFFMNNRPAFVLPLTWRPDFLEHERKAGDKKGAPTMEVAWTVWVKGSDNTLYNPLKKPVL